MINYCFPTFYHEIDLNQELEKRKIDLLELQKASYEIKEIYLELFNVDNGDCILF